MVDLLKQKQNGSGSEPFALISVFLFLTLVFGFWGLITPTPKIIAALDVPQLISFQGKLTDQNRITVADGSLNMKFAIYTASSGGTCLWSAKDTDANSSTIDCPGGAPGGSVSVSVTDGVFYILLGDTSGGQNALPDSLFDDNAALYVGVTIASDAEMSPRIRLASAPFSMQSGDADLLDSFNTSQTGGSNVVAVTDASGNLVLTGSARVAAGQGITTSGAGALKLGTSTATSVDLGSASVTAFTVFTDGTGDTEVALPTGSIGSIEITDNSLDFSDLADALTIDAATTVSFTAAGSVDPFKYVLTNNAGSATTQRAFTIGNGLTAQTGDVLTEALLVLDNADTGGTGSTVVVDALTVTVSGGIVNGITDAIDATDTNIVNALNIGDNIILGTAGVINFDEFDVSGTTGSITIDDGGNAGQLLVEGTNLDLNSLDFNGIGTITTTATNALNLTPNNGLVVSASGTPADVAKFTTGGAATGIHLDDTAGLAQSNEANSLLYLTQPDASNRYGFYIDTEETTQTQTVIALESDTTNGSGADTLKFRVDASGEAFSDVGFSSGATTKFSDGIVHKIDPGTLSFWTYGGAGDDILLDELTLTVEADQNEVGFGTRDPQANLDVVSYDNDEFIRLSADADSAGLYLGSSAPTFAAEGGSLFILTDANGSQAPGLYLNTSTADTGTEWSALPLSATTEVTNVTSYGNGGGGGNRNFERIYAADDDKTLTLGIEGLALDTTDTDMNMSETFAASADLEAGTLVAVDTAVAGQVAATGGSYASGIIGVVTDSPALLLSDVAGEKVARSGVATVKVNDENGAVSIGDALTSSSTAGVAMKATEPGEVVGFALAGFAGPGEGTVTVAVAPHWFAGNVLTTDGAATLFSDDLAMTALGVADAVTTAYDSQTIALRGSAWDAVDLVAEEVSMSIITDVTAVDDYRLSIMNGADTQVAYVNDDGDLALAGHFYPSDRGALQTSKYIFYDGSEGFGGDFMRTNASGWGTGSYDFAEMFPSGETLESGDLVVFGENNESVERSSSAYDRGLAGIVSTRPGFLAGDNFEGHYPIALAGRVPTKVSLENGPIKIGDPLTSSSTPGHAMKATEAGPIVGYALEPYDSTTQQLNDSATIIAFVNVSYWSGSSNEPRGLAASVPTSLSTLSTLTMYGDLYLTGNKILSVGSISGIGNRWSIADDGRMTTEGSYDVMIESYQGEDVPVHALTSMEQKITLSGTAQLDGGRAAVVFEDVDPFFNDVISTTAPVRVLVTPRGPSNGLFVAEADHNGFTVEENMAGGSSVDFDWFVEAYRKGFEPVEEEADEAIEEDEAIEADEAGQETEEVDEDPSSLPTDPEPTDESVMDETTSSNELTEIPMAETQTETQPIEP